MATSTLRFVIIVALVVGGIVLIDQAFRSPSATGTLGSSGASASVSPSPSPSPSGHPSHSESPPPDLTGVNVAVFNGTSVTGLAGDTLTKLEERYGVVSSQDPADAPSQVVQTELFYRSPADKAAAQFLAARFFKNLPEPPHVTKLEPGSDVSKDTQIAIYLGNDYATLQG